MDTQEVSPQKAQNDAAATDEVEEVDPASVDYLLEKKKGNDLLASGDVDGAIECWHRPIRSLTFILNKCDNKDVDQDKWNYFLSLYLSLCLNLSLGYLKKGEYNKCKEYCQLVFKYDEKNLKAYLRTIQADKSLCNYKEALVRCKEALVHYPGNKELALLEYKINEELASQAKTTRKVMKNIFDNIEHDPRTCRRSTPYHKYVKNSLSFLTTILLKLYTIIVEGIRRFILKINHYLTKIKLQ